MRNTDQYPITLDEMIEAVERAAEQELARLRLRNAPIGGIQGMALQEAASRLKRLQFAALPTPPQDMEETKP